MYIYIYIRICSPFFHEAAAASATAEPHGDDYHYIACRLCLVNIHLNINIKYILYIINTKYYIIYIYIYIYDKHKIHTIYIYIYIAN